jgi:hypothetical protein
VPQEGKQLRIEAKDGAAVESVQFTEEVSFRKQQF